MEIDLFTFIAQIVNFLVLLFLLYKFLFGRVKQAMDERDARIRSTIESADRKMAEADALKAKHASALQSIADEREAMLAGARAEASSLRERLMQDAEEAIRSHREQLQSIQAAQEEKFISALKAKGRDFIYALANKTVTDLADESLEERIALKFAGKVRSLAESERTRLTEALRAPGASPIIRSTFPVTPAVQRTISDAVAAALGYSGAIRFESGAKDLYGIALIAGAHTISWSIDAFVSGIERDLFPANSASTADRGLR
ncbi:MAG: hypothetical protein AABZ39_18510 [Spirochaetota bacterium]